MKRSGKPISDRGNHVYVLVTIDDMTVGDMVCLFREEAMGERNILMLERDIGSR